MVDHIQKKFDTKIIIESIDFNKNKSNSSKEISKALKTSQTKVVSLLNNILSQNTINLSSLKSLCWNGIPINYPGYHAEAWKYLLGYYPLNGSIREENIKRKRQEYLDTRLIYDSMLQNPFNSMNDSEKNVYKDINKDVPRTMPKYSLFQIPKIKEMMTRVLYVWSMRYPASSYVQGFNDLCTPFFIIFINEKLANITIEEILFINEELLYNLGEEKLLEIESDIYLCFTKMMAKIQSNYTNNQPGLNKMIQKMEEIIKIVDCDLYNKINQMEIKFIHFAFRWMNCYLMRELEIIPLIRLWDTYFSEDNAFNDFHLYVCSCLLLNFSNKIKEINNNQELIMFLQNLPTNTWSIENIDILLAKAYQISSMYSDMIKG